MGYKRWICFGVNTFFGIAFLVVGIIVEPVLEAAIQDQVNSKAVMTEDNYNTWGYIPGHTDVHIKRSFTMFDVLNPEEVKWSGAKPTLNVTREYIYYEFDQYIERVYLDYDGTDDEVVEFIWYQYFDPTEDWPSDLSGEDVLTTVNVGSITVWSQLKNLPYFKLAAPTIATLIQGLDSVFVYAAYSEGLSSIFSSESQAKLLVFTPAGISDEKASVLWGDENFGWNNFTTLLYWVLAVEENQDAQYNFQYQQGAQGINYMLKSYFGLDDAELSSILQILYEYYDITAIAISNAYSCPQYQEDHFRCDPHYFTTMQWASQNVTMNPPPPASPSMATPSVAQQNSTITGYPEITYFQSFYYNTTNPLRNVTWSMEEGLKLLNYTISNGYPSGTPYTLLDQGHMQDLLDFGGEKDWYGISSLFALNSTDKAEILYDYVINLIEITALLNQTNVRKSMSLGPTEELGVAQLLQQTMLTLYNQLVGQLPIYITSAQAYGDIVLTQNKTCDDYFQDAGIKYDFACQNENLTWSNFFNMQTWIEAFWYGQNSTSWNYLVSEGNIHPIDMESLYNYNSTLSQSFRNVDSTLYSHYNCTNPGTRCFDQQIYEKQWGSSFITRNPTVEMTKAGLQSTNSLTNWTAINQTLVYPPEYYVYAIQQGANGLNDQQAHQLMGYNGTLNQIQLQRWFIAVVSLDPQDKVDLQNQYNLKSLNEVDYLTDYYRRMIDAYALNNLFAPTTVNKLLWTGSSQIIQKLAATNPLKGGDPSLDPTLIQLGRNITEAKLNFPAQYKHAMYTGQKSVEKTTRRYHKYFGSPYIKNFIKTYRGNDENGPIIYQDQIDPWAEPNIQIIGTDGLAFHTAIDSDSDVYVFLYDLQRFGKGEFVKTVDHKGLKCYRFSLPKNLLYNVENNKANSIYYQYGPNGMGNLTSVVLGPVFVSKSFFYGTDPTVVKAINFTNWQVPDEEDYAKFDTFFDIEKYSGANFYCKLQIQGNVELKPDILYPRMGQEALQELGQLTSQMIECIYYLDKFQQLSF